MPETRFITLKDDTGAQAVIAPEFGAWLIRYARPMPGHGLVEALHHDPAVVARYPRQMYAGNPILFPIASKNVVDGQDHRYTWGGRTFDMPQHGFARLMPWRVTEQDAGAVTMELVENQETKLNYPFAFRLSLTYRLQGGRLSWEQSVENRSAEPLPFSTGFHPYIRLPLTAASRREACFVDLPACRRWRWTGNYEAFQSEPFAATRLSVMPDVSDSLLLDDLPRPELSLHDEGSGLEVALNFEQSPQHRFVVIWSRSPAEPFYCIEPWTALPNPFSRLETGELMVLAPGDVFRAGMFLEVRQR